MVIHRREWGWSAGGMTFHAHAMDDFLRAGIPSGGFSFSYACERGLTAYRLRELRREGSVRRLAKGAYVVAASVESLTERARALSRVLPPHAIVTRRTAAWLWGLDVLPPGVKQVGWPVEVVVPSGRTPPRRPGCRSYQTPLQAADIVDLSGVRTTSLERTALDCARWLPRLEAVAALDQFLRAGVNRAQLIERALVLAGRRNARRLREVIDISDPGAMLPGESWTRTIIIDAGLPRPTTQIAVAGPNGTCYFLDMGFEAHQVAVEYDGDEFHTSPAHVAHDRARRRWLREVMGWEIIVVTKADILGDPLPFLAALTTALMERGWNPTPEQLDELETGLARLRFRRRYHA